MNSEQEREYYAKIARRKPLYEVDCDGCGGAGYVRYERPVGHPLFGQITVCRTCNPAAAVPEPVKDEQWWQK